MKVLVTGGAGFIGTNFIKLLKQNKHLVISVDNYSTGNISNHQEGVKYLNFDITNPALYDQLHDIEIVFHLAAIARIQPSFERPADYFMTNAYGTFLVAHFCTNKNIPLVYAGSSSHHSGKFKNPYTFSKDVGEEVVTLFQQHFNLQASIARFYNVYGPHQLTDGSYTTLIGRWIKRKEEGLPLIIYGDGSKRRDFTHVDDIIKALYLIYEKEVWGEVFELGREKNYSVLEVAKMFNHPYLFEDDKPGEAAITLSDISAARKKLGWEPSENLENYLESYFK